MSLARLYYRTPRAETKKLLRFGLNQEGLFLEMLSQWYKDKGIIQSNHQTWSKISANFANLKQEISDGIRKIYEELHELLHGVFPKNNLNFKKNISK